MGAIQIGDRASLSRTITQDDIRRFAELTGDDNPVHLDEEFARGTRFGRCIAHGLWAGTMVATVLGTRLPGTGTVYLNQVFQFRAPVFAGDTVTATLEVVHVREDRPIATLSTVCTNQDGVVVLDGEAVVMLPPEG